MNDLRCCRCGREPRHRYAAGEEAFLCPSCLADPAVRAEVFSAQRMGDGAGRIWLIKERGWVGGWPSLRELRA
jgi:hypothetical protein